MKKLLNTLLLFICGISWSFASTDAFMLLNNTDSQILFRAYGTLLTKAAYADSYVVITPDDVGYACYGKNPCPFTVYLSTVRPIYQTIIIGTFEVDMIHNMNIRNFLPASNTGYKFTETSPGMLDVEQ